MIKQGSRFEVEEQSALFSGGHGAVTFTTLPVEKIAIVLGEERISVLAVYTGGRFTILLSLRRTAESERKAALKAQLEALHFSVPLEVPEGITVSPEMTFTAEEVFEILVF